MRVITAFLVAVVVSASPALAGELKWHLWQDVDGIQFGGFVDEMNSIKLIDAEDGNDRRIVYGDRLGLIHVVRFNEGRFQEEWVSPTLKGPIAEVFLEDVNADGNLEILAYTELGEIIMFSAQEYTEIWRSTDDEFDTISAMVLADVDDDPQMEMIFTAESVADVAGYRRTSRGGSPEDAERAREEEISRLYVYDSLFTFREWSTEQGVTGTSIVVADLDDDGILEIALNSGFIVDASFQRVEWRWPDGFGERIGFADLDGDGIPELIGEYRSVTRPRRTIRVFDVDLQAENFLSRGR
jgi:hypothetical protein